MNKRQLIQDNPTLLRRRPFRALAQLLAVAVGYGAPLYFAARIDVISVWVIACLVAGFVLSGLFSGMHYAAHGTVFASKTANRLVGRLMSLPIIVNFTLYKYLHLEHHKHTNVPGDTEVGGQIRSLRHYMFYLLNWDFVYVLLKIQYRALFQKEVPYFVRSECNAKGIRLDALLTTLWIVLIFTAALINFRAVLLLYLIPLQLAWSFNYLFSLPEHYDCEESSDVFTSTRTIALRSRLARLFYWNSNYHAEHHLIAAVPFYNLPAAHEKIVERLNVLEESYCAFHSRLIKSLLRRHYEPKEASHGRLASFVYPTVRL